jgi:hypothetical protein
MKWRSTKNARAVIVSVAASLGGFMALPAHAEEPAPAPGSYTGDSYLENSKNLTEDQKIGRDTWYLWTGGGQSFWSRVGKLPEGVDLLRLLDTRNRDRRWQGFGLINQPGCQGATEPDEFGLWLDRCQDEGARTLEGEPADAMGQPTGVIGVRKFRNAKFNPDTWDPERYYKDVNYVKDPTVEPPYVVGLTCGICHIGFNPLNPPDDPRAPAWSNLVPAIGNQYLEEGRIFLGHLPPNDFRWHVGSTQQPGTSDTSRFATDHINNPNVINSIVNLDARLKLTELPDRVETMPDGSRQAVPHILKDGADSVGVATASLRVYVNIGMCSDYWLSRHDALRGTVPQKPFEIAVARQNCEGWRQTENRMPAAEAFLKTLRPMYLKDAPGGAKYLTTDQKVMDRGKQVFAENCAMCHSSKRPPANIDEEKTLAFFEEAVKSPDFLNDNFLSDDERKPVTLIGTNAGRALSTNATAGHIWDNFSSQTYKGLQSAGTIEVYNPLLPAKPLFFDLPAGGRGYYRTPTLVGIWATAPFLHNNSLGIYNKDPSVNGRMAAFNDAIEKLLWPERRLGPASIKRTSIDSYLNLPSGRQVRIPAGTPINMIANLDPEKVSKINLLLGGANLLLTREYSGNLLLNPDLVEDKGHHFGTQLPDEDKLALIEFIKTF